MLSRETERLVTYSKILYVDHAGDVLALDVDFPASYLVHHCQNFAFTCETTEYKDANDRFCLHGFAESSWKHTDSLCQSIQTHVRSQFDTRTTRLLSAWLIKHCDDCVVLSLDKKYIWLESELTREFTQALNGLLYSSICWHKSSDVHAPIRKHITMHWACLLDTHLQQLLTYSIFDAVLMAKHIALIMHTDACIQEIVESIWFYCHIHVLMVVVYHIIDFQPLLVFPASRIATKCYCESREAPSFKIEHQISYLSE